MSATQREEVVVLGAGVVGLTTAIVLQEKGDYRVTVIADTLPGDERSSKYTSNWAVSLIILTLGNFNADYWIKGAHHVTLSGKDARLQKIDRETFEYMWKLSEPGKGDAEGCFLRLKQEELYEEGFGNEAPLDYYPNWQEISSSTLQPGIVKGVEFETLTIDVPIYLPYLAARFLSKGGTICRGTIQHIDQILEGGPRSGEVVVGGVKEVDDWYPLPRQETKIDILRRGLALCPELTPPEVRQAREPTVEDLLPLVIEDSVGLRPCRKDGLRLESQRIQTKDGRAVPLVFNYGHAGHGYISSWGCAFSVAEMLAEEFKN
ncbi:D-amino-acid oxidase [Leucoagaricus sp. SymC.cos]|nr:D-amino-acid oxidase [Leucoagaricus sp. SymC.cos]